jgi:hypothetical protein
MTPAVAHAVAERIAETWADVERAGWSNRGEAFNALYPMPGDEAFENNELFCNLPLFVSPGGEIVRAGDQYWEFPTMWHHEVETRTPSALRLNFGLKLNDGRYLLNHPAGRKLDLALRRLMYLIVFRSRRPLAIRTLKSRLDAAARFARHAAISGKNLHNLAYSDLATVVGAMGYGERGSISAIYDELRWWRSQPGTSYCFFVPPPSMSMTELDGSRVARVQRKNGAGFDPSRVRDDPDPDPDERKRSKPLPDAFVAGLGEVAICLVNEVRPIVISCCKRLLEELPAGTAFSSDAALHIVLDFDWPERFKPRDFRYFVALCNDCQTATEILVSLLLGPRARELLSLPGSCVRRIAEDDDEGQILEGHKYKLTRSFGGEKRDWPIHPIIADAIAQQREYVELTEGSDFPYLWKSHAALFCSGEPARGIWQQLQTFVRRHGLLPLLDAGTCHHHRFRKTVVRLVVLALHGAPMVLRRLLGHEDLAMTLLYILSDETIVDELRELAEQERKTTAAEYIERREALLGKGGETLREAARKAAETLSLFVPEGKRSQREITSNEIVEFLASGPDGLTIQQVVPGMIGCSRPSGEAGLCCSENGTPNVANCDLRCKWQAMLPESREMAIVNVADALAHIRADDTNPLCVEHYGGVVQLWNVRFPDIVAEFEGDELFEQLVA